MTKPLVPKKARALPAEVSVSKGIQSVEIGVRVLDALAFGKGPSPLKDIAHVAKLSASQAHRYLASLQRTQLVRQDPVTGLYDLGSRTLQWGMAALSRLDAVELAGQFAKKFSLEHDVTALVAIWGERGATCVRWYRGSSLVASDVGLGTVFPLVGSATGEVFLAYLPDNLLACALPKGQLKSAQARRQEVQQNGYAVADQLFVSSLGALAAPVRDAQGGLVAVITVVLKAEELSGQKKHFAGLLVQHSLALSRELGYQTP